MAATLDHAVDPFTVECDPEPYGCGQPTGQPCVTTAVGRFYGQPKRRPCLRRSRKAGVVYTPTRPDEVAAAPLRRSDTAAGRAAAARRARQGRPDYAGIADR